MNIDSGKILPWQDVANKMQKADQSRHIPINPTPKQKARKRISRNDKCPCGSGKKFKKCCLRRSFAIAPP
jgi:uncharacterized protein YecA (UPF0149 family)